MKHFKIVEESKNIIEQDKACLFSLVDYSESGGAGGGWIWGICRYGADESYCWAALDLCVYGDSTNCSWSFSDISCGYEPCYTDNGTPYSCQRCDSGCDGGDAYMCGNSEFPSGVCTVFVGDN